MLLELVITACLAATGGDCRLVVLDTFPTQMQCVINAQPLAVLWSARNPSRVITGMICRPAGKDA
ncbi:MAG TPA: hypothetical protein VD860_16880 [Azospirillum sp.]|nr:hypothetical protein [Azospirillum sp.]